MALDPQDPRLGTPADTPTNATTAIPDGGQPTPGQDGPQPQPGEKVWAGSYESPEALEQGHNNLREVYGRTTNEVGRLRDENARLQAQFQGDAEPQYAPEPDVAVDAGEYGARMLDDPEGYTRDVITAAVRETVKAIQPMIQDGVQGGLTQQQRREQQKQHFYSLYPDLSSAPEVVDAVAKSIGDNYDTSAMDPGVLQEMLVSRCRQIVGSPQGTSAQNPGAPPVSDPTPTRQGPGTAPQPLESEESRIHREVAEEVEAVRRRQIAATTGFNPFEVVQSG